MQPADIDIFAGRLVYAECPFGTQARERIARIDRMQFDARAFELREESIDCRPLFGATDMERAQRFEEPARREQRPRSRGQRLDVRAAIGFGPEGGRTSGGVIAGAILGLEQQHAGMRRNFSCKTRTGDPRADDGNVIARHPRVALASRKASISPNRTIAHGVGFAENLVCALLAEA